MKRNTFDDSSVANTAKFPGGTESGFENIGLFQKRILRVKEKGEMRTERTREVGKQKIAKLP